jgi:hypothetical protein
VVDGHAAILLPDAAGHRPARGIPCAGCTSQRQTSSELTARHRAIHMRQMRAFHVHRQAHAYS